MSKLSKLIKTPDLYFKDAIIKRAFKNKETTKTIKTKPNDLKKSISTPLSRYNIDLEKSKINLIIFDNIPSSVKIKKNIAKFQYRSIEKYCNFSSVSYISEDILSYSKEIKIYQNYEEFYKNMVLKIYPKNEIFVFINLNFFFLKNVKPSNFISENGKAISYIKKNKDKTINFDTTICKIIDGASYNFTPMENLNICNTMSLIYLDKIDKNNLSQSDFIFKLIPVTSAILQQNALLDSPIQYARLNAGYIEKFVWIQSVHGSSRCPLAITFDKNPTNEQHYEDFLESLFPHPVMFETTLTTKN